MEKNNEGMWIQTLWNPLDEMKKSPLESKEPGIRVVAYCRISNDKNNFSSLENQVSYYTNLIRSRLNWKFIGVYVDKGISGATFSRRSSFKRMIRHCEEGRIDLILTKSISRFSRNSKELIEIVNHLKDMNVGVYFEKENIDTSINYNQFLMYICAAYAQDELETISQLAITACQQRFIKGIPLFRDMYGYEVIEQEGKLVCEINEQDAKVVRWIFDQFIGGKNYAQINRELITKGIKRKNGGIKWTSSFVRKIILDISYTGNKIARQQTKDLLTGKVKQTKEQRDQYLILNSHPAIISGEIFIEAQKRSEEVGYKNKNEQNTKIIRPFLKRITCGRCGEKFRVVHSASWLCANAFPSMRLCDNKIVKDKQLLKMVLEAFNVRFDFNLQNIRRQLSCAPVGQVDILNEMLKILHRINKNDHFEFHRLKLLAEIEIANCEADHSQEKVNILRNEYELFERKVSKIEEDRKYRDQAIKWIDSVHSLKEFEEIMTLEIARAWISDIEIYSEDGFIVKWIDEEETIVGEDKIEKIKKQVQEKAEKNQAVKTNNDDLLNEKKRENKLHLGEEVHNVLDTFINDKYSDGVIKIVTQNNDLKTVVKAKSSEKHLQHKTLKHNPNLEIIELEPGLGIEAVTNIKENMTKTKALNLMKENQKKLRVACYCRVSTHLDEQCVSLQTQIAYYTYLILKNPNWSYAGTFSDEGESGTSVEHRDDFNRMINKAKAGKIDLIITKSISRFSRNVVDVLETIKTLKELPNPVNCYFEKENINTADEKSSMLITLMSSVAQNEISNLSSSITWGIRRLAQRGIIHKATDLYGYSIDKNRNWEVVPEEANVIRYIAKEFLNGKSFNEIIKDLHDKAIKSPSGKSYWHDGQIRGMLRNEKYKGDYLFQKRYTPEVIGSKIKKNNGEVAQYYIENHHPSIIDEKQWYLLQEEFKIRSKAPIENRKTPRTAGRGVFYNKYFCSNCGGTITRYRSQNREGREGGHWRCYNSYGTIKECYVNCSIKQEYLELNFYETLRLIGLSEEFKEKVEKVIEKLSLTMEELKHKNKIKENIDDLNQHLYIAVDYELNEVGHDIKKIDYLTGEIIKLQDQLKAYDERIEKVDYYKTELNELLKVCKAIEPISFREFHNMDVRIKPGDSIYDTTKNTKDRTYIKEDKKDYFPEVIFEKYINKCQVDHEGRITYIFLFGVDFVIDMTNQGYLDAFEKTKAEINLEELLISKEAIELRKFCKEAKYPREMRSYINISSNNSFRKRILKPLIQVGKLKLIRGTGTNDWSYYWNEEN